MRDILKKGINSLSHIRKKGSIPWVMWIRRFTFFFESSSLLFHSWSNTEKKVQFCESYWQNLWTYFQKKKIDCLGHIYEKNSILCVKYLSESCWKERFNFCESCWKKWFSSVSHVQKRVQFFESSKSFFTFIDIFSDNQFFEYFSKKFNSYRHISKRKFKSSTHLLKEGSFLWILHHVVEEKPILWVKMQKSLWVMFKKRSIIFEQQLKTRWILWFQLKKSSISRVTKKFKFLKSQNLQSSILCVMKKKKKVQFFWVTKKGSILESYWKKIQFIETYSKEGSILRVIFSKRRQFFESNWKKSILWVTSKRKEFNSLSPFFFQKFQFFESYFPKNDQFNWVIHFVK